MGQRDQHILGKLSEEVLLTSDGKSINIRPVITQIELSESLFRAYVVGKIFIQDTQVFRIFELLKFRGAAESTITFSFSGKNDDGISEETEISIKDYIVLDVKMDFSNDTSRSVQSAIITFVHPIYFDNIKTKISKCYKDQKISEIVDKLGKEIQLDWNVFEETDKDPFHVTFTYDNPFNHIFYLSRYAKRQENPNDINYLFWQDLSGKHNFCSLGKLYEQSATVGEDVNTGYIYGNNLGQGYSTTRKIVYAYSPFFITPNERAIKGEYKSSVFVVDAMEKNFTKTKYDSREDDASVTKISQEEFIDQNSSFWENFVDKEIKTTQYVTSRHCYCCNEKGNRQGFIGGEEDTTLKRQAQTQKIMSQGIEFEVSGSTNREKIGAGKIFYFGRPKINKLQNSQKIEKDLYYSGKYLAESVVHYIVRTNSENYRYSMVIRGLKDSIGEEI